MQFSDRLVHFSLQLLLDHLIKISVKCAFGNISEIINLFIFIALPDHTSQTLCKVSRSPRTIKVMKCNKLVLHVSSCTHFLS